MATDLVHAPPRDLTRADPEQAAGALEHILATGDLSQLTPAQRIAHYLTLCHSLGLNSLSRPFDWLVLDNQLVLYPNKSCAEQLRRLHQISVKKIRQEPVGELFVVEVEGRTPDGRVDFASKYVPTTTYNQREGRYVRLNGRDLANAYAKAETGAKRRLVLSMVGLAGLPDVDELTGARQVIVDGEGNVIDAPTDVDRSLAGDPSMAKAIGEPIFEDAGVDDAPAPATASQVPTEAELQPAKRDVPRQSFKPSDEDVKRWQGGFFATVKGTSLDNDEDRHHLVSDWTAKIGWPQRKQTDSMTTMFRRMAEDEAQRFLNHVKAMVAAERGEHAGPDPALEDDSETPF